MGLGWEGHRCWVGTPHPGVETGWLFPLATARGGTGPGTQYVLNKHGQVREYENEHPPLM